ncbi:MAG TPA: nucleoside 2-deoxyribosyltransferase [Chloroflexota bacterium]|nr:nucleoside 2-deoxyribosyltransferase [Chloroflexota bacterium]
MLLYFAGPLFSEAEKRFNQQLTDKIEALGYRVFLPQRDGVERGRSLYDAMSPDERRRLRFALDKANVLACDVFLFVLDGRVPDEGACVELGIAYCQKELRQPTKLLLGLQTDVRVAFPSGALNTMVGVPLERVVHTEDALLELLQQIRAT